MAKTSPVEIPKPKPSVSRAKRASAKISTRERPVVKDDREEC